MQGFQRYLLLIYRFSFALTLLSFQRLASGCDEERRRVAEFMRESTIFCSTCTISSLKKFTLAISFADELHVILFARCRCASWETLSALKIMGL